MGSDVEEEEDWEMGEPWGMPVWTGLCCSRWPSKVRQVNLLLRKVGVVEDLVGLLAVGEGNDCRG